MCDQHHAESLELDTRDPVTGEIVRLLGLVKRLEHENASLRRALGADRPVAA